MKTWMFAALAMSVLPMAASAQGFGGGNGGGSSTPSLTFYTNPDFGGGQMKVTGEVSALGRETGMNDKASSLKVVGNWEICADTNFKGKCVTIAQDSSDLKLLKMNDNISSARPKSGFGGGNGGEQDSNITKYDDPRWQGVPIFYCGKSISNCGEPNADGFCQLVGHSDSYTYSAGKRTSNRGYVPKDNGYQSGGMMFASISCLGTNSGGGPGFGGGNGGGQPSISYPAPSYQGAAIAWCGKGSSNCGEPNAKAFCKAQGHAGTVSYTEGPRTEGQIYSAAELSFRRGGRTYRSISCTGGSGGSGDGGFQGGNGGGPGFGGGNGGSQGGNGGGFGSKTFEAPVFNGMRINSCDKAASSCGKVSADAFCRTQSYGNSSSHKLLNGLTGPLVSPADSSITLVGQAFESVTCTN